MKKNTKNKLCFFGVTVAAILCAANLSFSQEEIKVTPQIIEEKLPAYTLSLKELIKRAQGYIKKTEEEIRLKKILEANRKKENEARELFAKAVKLYEEGKLEEARDAWKQSLAITKDPEMKNYINRLDQQSKLGRADKKRQASQEAKQAAQRRQEEKIEQWQELRGRKAAEKEQLEKERPLKERLRQEENTLKALRKIRRE